MNWSYEFQAEIVDKLYNRYKQEALLGWLKKK